MSESNVARLAGAEAPHPDNSSGTTDYLVIARRYRPQTFSDLVGQQHIAQVLTNAIRSGRVGHAYLFTGARGVGKTSTARIFAKALNCVEGPTPTPCNQCDICQSISLGEDVDVLEIDGASNRGIDEIRELRQNVGVRPSRARFKIYIIDEVHMLTREAFNALLKTLEEPPEHAKFVFCTTEPQKIPITIHSRCQRFDFAGVETHSIAERLATIAQDEGVRAEAEALELIARRAGGSMRDAQSLLEQVLALCQQDVSLDEVQNILGTAAEQQVADLIECLANRDPGQALRRLDDALTQGVELSQFLDQLLAYLRDAMVAAAGGTADQMLYSSPSQWQTLRSHAERLGLATILAAMQTIDHARARMRYSSQPRILAEMALARAARLADLENLTDLIDQLRPLSKATASTTASPSAPATSSERFERPSQKKSSDDPVRGARADLAAAASDSNATEDHCGPPVDSTARAAQAPAAPQEPPRERTPAEGERLWKIAIESLNPLDAENASLYDHVTTSGTNQVVVFFTKAAYTSYRACQRRVPQLEKEMSRAAGRPIRLTLQLLETETDDTAPTETATARPVSSRQQLREAAQHAMVRRASELFDARPVRVETPDS